MASFTSPYPQLVRRVNLFMSQDLVEKLEKLPGTLSENIRKSVEFYLKDLEESKVSASLSKKGGD